MSHFGRITGAVFVALSVLVAATMLNAAPEAVRWALLICILGFVGATMRLRRIDSNL